MAAKDLRAMVSQAAGYFYRIMWSSCRLFQFFVHGLHVSHQLEHGQLFGFCLDLDGNIQVQPAFGKVHRMDIIMMISWIPVPPGPQGA